MRQHLPPLPTCHAPALLVLNAIEQVMAATPAYARALPRVRDWRNSLARDGVIARHGDDAAAILRTIPDVLHAKLMDHATWRVMPMRVQRQMWEDVIALRKACASLDLAEYNLI